MEQYYEYMLFLIRWDNVGCEWHDGRQAGSARLLIHHKALFEKSLHNKFYYAAMVIN